MTSKPNNANVPEAEPQRFDSAAAGAHLVSRPWGGPGVSRSFGLSSGLRSLGAAVTSALVAVWALAVGLVGSLIYRFAQHYEYFRALDAASALDPMQELQSRLSYTECDILTLMARGYSDMRIGEILSLQRASFDSYLRHIYLAVGLTNRGQLRVWIAEHGDKFRR